MAKIEIRQLSALDWQEYRNIRLEALIKHPDCFLPSRDETQFSSGEWEARLSRPTSATFGLYFDSQLVGITTIFIDEGTGAAQLVGSYLKEEFRGRGLSRLFYETRLNWARTKGIRKVRLEHRSDNLKSCRAHKAFGSKQIGSQDELWPDGKTLPSLIFEIET